MSERKVLNKYYPPDFDARKIPRMRLSKNRQYTVRIMTPFNMKCKTCGDYIAKAKKFNARKETVESETYLGLKIFRFYFKCPTCMAEITFKTDPKNCDYELEHGAIRNFDAFRKAQEMAERQAREEEEEEKMNIMKKLEKRTKASRREMEELEELEEIKDINEKKIMVNHENLIENQKTKMKKLEDEIKKRQEEEDETLINEMKRYQNKNKVSCELDEEIIEEIEEINEEEQEPKSSSSFSFQSNQFDLAETAKPQGSLKRKLNGLIKMKTENFKTSSSKEEPKQKLTSLCAYSDSDSN